MLDDDKKKSTLRERVGKLDNLFTNDMPEYIMEIENVLNGLMMGNSEIRLPESTPIDLFREFLDLYTKLSDVIKLLTIVDKNLSVTTDSFTIDSSRNPLNPVPPLTPSPIRGDVRISSPQISNLLFQADRTIAQADDLMVVKDRDSPSAPLKQSVGSEIKSLKFFITKLSQSLSESKSLSTEMQSLQNPDLRETFINTLKTIGDLKNRYEQSFKIFRKQIKFLYKKCLFLFLFLDFHKEKLEPTMQSDLENIFKRELTSTKQRKEVDTLYDLVISQKIFTPKEISTLIKNYDECIARLVENPYDECINNINGTNTTLQYIFSAVTILLLLL